MSDDLSTILSPNNFMWPMLKTILPIFFIGLIISICVQILEISIKQKKGKYFLRRYKIEFLTLLFAAIGYFIGYMFLPYSELVFLFSIIVTFIATAILIYVKSREKDFYFVALHNSNDREDWIGDGGFKYERVHGAYSITNSDSGFIFSKCLNWSDYVFDFEFKILNKSLGVIVRATNLSNLVMMQIFENGIKPHIKINGFWQSWSPKESKLEFSKNLNSDKWYRCVFQCDKRSVRIRIYNIQGDVFFDRVWEIPSGVISFSFDSADNSKMPQPMISSIPFPINLEYGTVGFRNYGNENALVENVLIEKIK